MYLDNIKSKDNYIVFSMKRYLIVTPKDLKNNISYSKVIKNLMNISLNLRCHCISPEIYIHVYIFVVGFNFI